MHYSMALLQSGRQW